MTNFKSVNLSNNDLGKDAWGRPKTIRDNSLLHAMFTFGIPVSKWYERVNTVKTVSFTNCSSEYVCDQPNFALAFAGFPMVGVVGNPPVPIVIVWLPSPLSITSSSSFRLVAAAMRATRTNGVSAVCRGAAGVGWIVAVAAAAVCRWEMVDSPLC